MLWYHWFVKVCLTVGLELEEVRSNVTAVYLLRNQDAKT